MRVHVLGPGIRRIDFEAPETVLAATAGQFVHVLCRDDDALDPLLRRPFSVADVDAGRGTASFLFQVRGRGTRWLERRSTGDVIDVFGPLGHGYTSEGLDPAGGPALLVGGGVGVPPLLLLARQLRRQGFAVQAALGFRTAAAVLLAEELRRAGADVTVATDDGSAGVRGTAAQVAGDLWGTAQAAFACGPWGMLFALERLRRASPRPLEVCVESVMGCGSGVCLSCVVPWRKRQGYPRSGWARACVEGPVFDASLLEWERCPA